MADRVIFDCAAAAAETVPLTADEVAQRAADANADAEALETQRAEALARLLMKRDRYLAQTDVLALPDLALPIDMPQAAKDELAANRDEWLAWRQKLRDYPATISDPLDPPPFPAQPVSPGLRLS